MAITWTYSRERRAGIDPAINDQFVSADCNVLTLRNPWIGDSVFMAKMYTSLTMVLLGVNTYIWTGSDIFAFEHRLDYYLAFIVLISSFVFAPFLWYRIFLIKRLTNFYFIRKLKKVIYLRNKTLIQFDWTQTEGGVFVRNEFSDAGFSTNFALAFGPQPAADQDKDRIVLWVDSNNSSDPDPRYVAQVWEYIRQFMEEGPDRLPAAGEPNWWYAPLHRICMPPAEAWRHYAPWRTGEPGEMQGKKGWLLPMWFVLFPYNMFSALCWYAVCRVFNVRGAPPPPEAFGR
jgi:hypothetical protein